MKNKCLLLLLCTIPLQIMQAAATENVAPKCIKLMLQKQADGEAHKVKIPLSDRENITGKTFKKLSEETIEKGLPLTLTHIIYTAKEQVLSEIVYTAALISSCNAWNNNILTHETTSISGKDLKPILRAAIRSRLKAPKIWESCSWLTVAIGPMYRNIVYDITEISVLIKNKKKLVLNNVTLPDVALLNEFTNDARMLIALHIMYATCTELEGIGKCKADFIEAERRILRTMKPREHEWL